MIKINTIQHYLSMSGIRITVSDVSSAAAKVQELHHLPALTAVIMGKILAGTSDLRQILRIMKESVFFGKRILFWDLFMLMPMKGILYVVMWTLLMIIFR